MHLDLIVIYPTTLTFYRFHSGSWKQCNLVLIPLFRRFIPTCIDSMLIAKKHISLIKIDKYFWHITCF
ncbi:hypothetical protein MGMO_163c00030 [Methyloglobulus morosus KoM1]|uniref:Uncharacterized protein n=1 Tax=Methyloglobulus morosus KoM1 TaxID=1116472 RepID=V5BSQ5_9GAMM|nr:hypothetical protein MGMO_163c00030 [Methyloglobulus morosus KoM1]